MSNKHMLELRCVTQPDTNYEVDPALLEAINGCIQQLIHLHRAAGLSFSLVRTMGRRDGIAAVGVDSVQAAHCPHQLIYDIESLVKSPILQQGLHEMLHQLFETPAEWTSADRRLN